MSNDESHITNITRRQHIVRFHLTGYGLGQIEVSIDADHEGEFLSILGSTARGVNIQPRSGNAVYIRLRDIRGKS